MNFFDNNQGEKEFLICVKNEYHAKHRHLPIIKSNRVLSNKFFPSAMASKSDQSGFGPNVLLHQDEAYLTSHNLDEMTHSRSNCAASILTAT
jgi:hypothetical protein